MMKKILILTILFMFTECIWSQTDRIMYNKSQRKGNELFTNKVKKTICFDLGNYQIIKDKLRSVAFNDLYETVNYCEVDSIVTELYDTLTSKWNPTSMGKLLCNINERDSVLLVQQLDEFNNIWINLFKNEYTYNNEGYIICGYDWNMSLNQWIPSGKTEYNFNTNLNFNQEILYSWNIDSAKWIGFSKTEDFLDNLGNIIMKVYSSWDNKSNQWTSTAKDTLIYDEYNNNTLYTSYSWVDSLYQWIPSYQYEFTYDTNNNYISESISLWIDSSDIWFTLSKSDIEYTYDIDGNITLILATGYNWNNNTLQWDTTMGKTEQIYDIYGNRIQNIIYALDESTGKWIPWDKYEWGFDGCENLIQETFFQWNYWNSYWIPRSRDNNYYSAPCITIINTVNEQTIRVYPNPISSGFVEIDVSDIAGSLKIEIFNIKGEKVHEQKLFNKNQIYIGNLYKGLYIYQIINNYSKLNTGKIIIE
jgi:hypothetical protein